MRKLSLLFLLLAGIYSLPAASKPQNELDRVIIYLNGKLIGTWRAGDELPVHIDNVGEGDTLTFRARTDMGGLGNSSIDIKDDSGVPIDNIQSINSVEQSADYEYVVSLKKIDITKVIALQVFLNFAPSREVAPPTIASVSLAKK
jgi:hypothetical protein